MKRLFVFGCSYTVYSWPSWADLLSCEYDQYENWGIAGIGNRGISERIIECHTKHKFTKDDTIIVQWSTHLRNDFFHQSGLLKERVPGWKTAGSLFNYLNQSIYDRKWLETFFDEEAYFMHTLHYILLIQNLLENIGANWYMTSISDVRNLGTDFNIVPSVYGETSIFTKIKEKFSNSKEKYFGYKVTPDLKIYNSPIWEDRADRWIEPIGTWIVNEYTDPFYEFTDNNETFLDYHPKTSLHKEWLVNCLIPKLNITPDIDRYNRICEQSDMLYQKYIENSKRDFEKRLFHTEFELPLWPNIIKGFLEFKDAK
jgi:hypothetical protein